MEFADPKKKEKGTVFRLAGKVHERILFITRNKNHLNTMSARLMASPGNCGSGRL
jgi:hypothetical protein